MIRKISLTTSALIAALLLTFTVVAPASAHSDTFQSTPSDDATVTTSVTELSMTFVEAVEPSFAPEVLLTSDAGVEVALGAPTFDASGATMTVPITSGALPNGSYTAAFRIVSADGHPASGEFVFTVEGSDADPLAGEPVEDVVAPEPITEEMLRTADIQEAQSQLQLGLGLAAAAAVIVAGVLVIVAVRRRRNSGRK
jgi:methionine-rich copper-binding protein CopC